MYSYIKSTTVTILSLFILIIFGCTPQEQQRANENDTNSQGPEITKAIATIHGTGDVSGTVTFEKVENGVRVIASISGLEAGKHGFHIHEFGDCSADDLTSAGGHYNPYNKEHGSPTQDNRHMGDMGNLVADSEGNADIDYIDPVIELNGSNSIIGRAVMIHAGEDDFESQPSGAAGSRIACGIVGIDG